MFSRKINRKSALALTLIVASFVAALLLANESNHTQTVWQSSKALPAGHVLGGNDLRVARALLGTSSGSYFTQSRPPLGSRLRVSVGAGEFLAKSALSIDRASSDTNSVPIRVSRSDFPSDLEAGQRVDLFALPVNQTGVDFSAVAVASGLLVESIDQRSKDYGSDVGIVLSVPTKLVYQVIANLVGTRIVVVRDGN